MGCDCVVKVIDGVLCLFFLLMAIVSPPFIVQIAVPGDYYPKQLVDLKAWYASEFGDYLVSESPHFFVGLVRLELLLIWPLSIANLFGFASGKSWYTTTCFIYGVSYFTSLAAILGELVGSGRASEKLLMIHSVFMGVAVLATIRDLTYGSENSAASVGPTKNPPMERKKRA